MLGELYGVWLLGFMLIWTSLVFALRGRPKRVLAPQAMPAAIPKPAVVIIPDNNKKWPFARQKPAAPTPPAPITVAAPAIPVALASPAVPVPLHPLVQPPAPSFPPAPPSPALIPAAPKPPAPPKAPSVPPPAPAQSIPMPTPPTPPAPGASSAKSANAPEFIGLHVMPRTPSEAKQQKQ